MGFKTGHNKEGKSHKYLLKESGDKNSKDSPVGKTHEVDDNDDESFAHEKSKKYFDGTLEPEQLHGLFAHDGKFYQVDYNETMQTIAVDEKYQDKNGKWKTKEDGFFAQGEDAEQIADDAGGWHIDKIVEYLDSAGALQEMNERKS